MMTSRNLDTAAASRRRLWSTLFGATAAASAMLVATPAMAQKKKGDDKAATAETPKPTKAYLPIAIKAEAAVKAKDWAQLTSILASAKPMAVEPVDQYWHGYFLLQQSLGTNDAAVQGEALDMMLRSGLTPAAQAPMFNFVSGKMAYQKKDFALALTRFEAARALGVTDPELGLLTAESYFAAGRDDEGVAYARSMIAADKAAGRVTPERVFVNAAKVLQEDGKIEDMMAVLTDRLAAYPTPDVWNSTLRILLQSLPEDKDLTLDTLRLMAATKSIKQRNEYLEYAVVAGDRGLPAEVVATIDAARAAGVTKVGDIAFDELYSVRKGKLAEDLASLAASARSATASPQPRLAIVTGDAYLSHKDYANAIAMYELAATKSGADVSLISNRLGVARAMSGDKAGALAAFDKVSGTRAMIANLWKVHLNSGAPAVAATTTAG